MCLYIKENYGQKYGGKKIKVKAKRDKVDKYVFKKVYIYNATSEEFFSEYFNFEYEIGFHYKNDNFPLSTTQIVLEGQGLHSFSMRTGRSLVVRGFAFLKCYISKGTPYYTGEHGDYISRELVIVSRMTKEEIAKLKIRPIL